MLSGINREETSLKKQSYFLFTGKLIAFAIQFITPIILVRLLSKEDYGLYQLAILIAITLQPILGLGLNSSLYYFFRIYKEKNAQLLSQTLLMTHIIGVIALILFIFAAGFLKGGFSVNNQTQNLLPIVVLVFFMLLS
jgi:O-antigen/teichoic acid export membrane protein